MKNKQVLSELMNLLSYVIIIFGTLFAFYHFDLSLITDYYDAKSIAEFSNESEYLQTYVNTFKNKMLGNVFTSVVIFLLSVVISVNLWFKSFGLFREVDEEYEEALKNEDAEEARKRMSNM